MTPNRWLLAAVMVALLALGASAAGDSAHAQESSTLVTNLNQSESRIINTFGLTFAQPFTTGSQAGGYELGSIWAATRQNHISRDPVPDGILAQVWTANQSNGRPVSPLYNLTVPSTSFYNANLTAPDGATLDADTTYAFVIGTTNAQKWFRTSFTASGSEYGAPGWSIKDGSWAVVGNSPAAGAWVQSGSGINFATITMRMQVNAFERTSQVLDSLLVEGSTDDANFAALAGAGRLSPDFARDITQYRATVPYDMTHVRLTPTPLNDIGQTISVASGAGPPETVPGGSASGSIPLGVGDNPVTVSSTRDGETLTYTVNIFRVPYGTVSYTTLLPYNFGVGGIGSGIGCGVGGISCPDRMTGGNNIFSDRIVRLLLNGSTLDLSFDRLPAAATHALNLCISGHSVDITSLRTQTHHFPTGPWAHDVPLSLSAGPSCGAPAPVTLVSNLNQTTGTSYGAANAVHAQGFTTGGSAGGYSLDAIGAVIENGWSGVAERDTIRAEVWSADGSGAPRQKLYDLTVPSAYAAPLSFGAPPGAVLNASTAYHFVLYTTGTYDARIDHANVTSEDAGAASGWSISDVLHWVSGRQTPGSNPSWGSGASNGPLRIAVNGTELPATSDPRDLTGLDLFGWTDGGDLVQLAGASAMAPAFDAGTTSYRATVANNVTYVTLLPEVADSSSALSVINRDRATAVTGTSVDSVPLGVGNNEIILRVTAQNGQTRDYTVNVYRVPSGTEWHATLVPAALDIVGTSYVGCIFTGTVQPPHCDVQLTDNSLAVGAANKLHRATLLPDNNNFQVVFNSDPHADLQALKFCAGATGFDIRNNTSFSVTSALGWSAGVPVSLSIGASCGAPAPVTLVSNYDQTAGASYGTDNNIHAQGFTTGGSAGGYSLDSVVVILEGGWPDGDRRDTVRAEVWSADASGAPRQKLYDLTVPPDFTTPLSLEAPTDPILNASTTYHLVLYTTGSFDARIAHVNATGEDAGGASGWSISDSRHHSTGQVPGASPAWGSSPDPLRITIRGTAASDPDLPAFSFDTSAYLVRENVGSFVVGVGADRAVTSDTVITMSRSDGTSDPSAPSATRGADYGGDAVFTATMTAGSDLVEFTQAILDDKDTEQDEAFTLAITGVSNDGGTIGGPSVVTIQDDDIAPPSDLIVTPGNGTLALSWTAPPGSDHDGYEVRHKNATAADQTATTTGDPSTGWVAERRQADTSTTYTITGLANGTLYDVQVRAESGATGFASAWISAQGTPGALSSNTGLASLTASGATGATGNFGAITLTPGTAATYTATVPHGITHVKVTPTVQDTGKATVRVGKAGSLAPVHSGTASAAIPVDVGANDIIVRVTAENTTAVQDHTITITRQEASSPPGAVGSLNVVGRNAQLYVSWNSVGGPPHIETGYEVQYKTSAAPDQTAATAGDPSTGWVGISQSNTPQAITPVRVNAANDVPYDVRVRAANSAGTGPWSYGSATPTLLPAISIQSVSPNPVAEGGTLTVTLSLSRLGAHGVTDIGIPLTFTADTAETDDYAALESITIDASRHLTASATVATMQDDDQDDDTFTISLGTLPSTVQAGEPSSVQVTVLDTGRNGNGYAACPADGTVWSATMTAGTVTVGTSAISGYNLGGSDPGTITGDGFSLDGAAYGIHSIRFSTDSGDAADNNKMRLLTDTAWPDDLLARLALHVDGTVYHLSSSTVPAGDPSGMTREWNAILDWHSGDQVELCISEATVGLSASRHTIPEGEGATVTATLSRPVPGATTIPLAVTSGSAEDGDYTVPGTVTIPSGRTAGTASISTHHDTDAEHEQFTISMGALPDTVRDAFRGVSGDGRTNPSDIPFTITDDEYVTPVTVVLSADPDRVREGGTVTITATLMYGDRPTVRPYDVTVPLRYNPHTAEEGDYTEVSRITIPRESVSGSAHLQTHRDGDSGDEQFGVYIGNLRTQGLGIPTQVLPGSPSAVWVTITEGNPAPPAETAGLEIQATPGNGEIYVSWNHPYEWVTGYAIQYKISSDDAWTDASYAGGARSMTIDGLLNGVTYDVRVRGIHDTGATGWAHAQATPTGPSSDPTAITLRLSADTVTEGETVTLTATLNDAAPPGGATVHFTAYAVTASPITDYILRAPDGSASQSGVFVTIPAGQTAATATIETKADGLAEGDETIQVGALTNVRIGTISSGDTTVTIRDPQAYHGYLEDPAYPAAVTISLDPDTAEEGAGRVTITATLDAPAPPGGIDLELYAAGDSTATRGTDYSMPDAIHVPAGERSGTARITLLTDTSGEGDETVIVSVYADTGPGILAAHATLTIRDSGGAPAAASPIPDIILEGPEPRHIDLDAIFQNPGGGDLTFRFESSHYHVVTGYLDGGTLTLVGISPGTAAITVTAEDPRGNVAAAVFQATSRPAAP